MIEIIDIRERTELQGEAIGYFWRQWGEASNKQFYRDCMERSCDTPSDIPRFYVALEGTSIIGGYALLRSDLNSRQDLFPWLACLYVNPEYRGQGLGQKLQEHAIREAKLKGYQKLYLCTDHTGYYERNQWKYIGLGYTIFDEETRIYEYQTGDSL
ncbi:N-acetyltransferase [Paenibacillus albidus]|uniref:N-acetyltransferase n=1 Tax=Paenibacillus albidus TaxID=2041023 RepID=A0A917BYK3_9BACL|nr:GNAT family N-acetyltransferase [Paenibacillus albidus]GGF63628.1 N-acetyltransferase [Paenibacillus albidus]